MEINREFLEYIEPYLIKLRERIGDFVVFGSAPLYLYGVVEFRGKINDLDVSIKDLSLLPSEVQVVTFQKDLNQKFYKLTINDLSVDIASIWPGCNYFFNEIHDKPVLVNGYKFANLDIIEEWKKEMVRKYDRQKDKDYLEKIKAWRDKEYL